MKALYPISGDPPTRGHGEILARAAGIFEQVLWALAVNPGKTYLFPESARREMMEETIRHYELNNVTVQSYSGSTARFAQQSGAGVILKGLRNAADLHTEMEQALGNRGIAADVETVVLFASPGLERVSSSLIRELALLGADLTPYVLPAVADRIREGLRKGGG